MPAQRAKLIEGGKLIIPATMRKSLGLVTGDTVTIELHDGEITVRTLQSALKRARAIVRQRIPAGQSLVDELMTERRAEADRE